MVGPPDQFLLQPAHLVLKAPVVSLKVLRLHLQFMVVLVQALLILVMCVIDPLVLMVVRPILSTLTKSLFTNSPPLTSSVFTQCYSLSSSALNSNALLSNFSLRWSQILLVCSSLGSTPVKMLWWYRIIFFLCLLLHPLHWPHIVLLQLLLHLPVLLQQPSDVETFLILVQADILKGKGKPPFVVRHSPGVGRMKQEEVAESIFCSPSTNSPSPAPSFASGPPEKSTTQQKYKSMANHHCKFSVTENEFCIPDQGSRTAIMAKFRAFMQNPDLFRTIFWTFPDF